MFVQTREVTLMNLRNLGSRLGSSSVIVVGIAGVVAVLVSILALAVGFSATLNRTGEPDRAAMTGAYVYEGAKSGRGQAVDWDKAAEIARHGRMILAGGLTPDNVAEAVRRVRPWGVDVSSAVESAPGEKDPGKIRTFIRAAKAA